MANQLSDDAVAIAASNLVVAVIQARTAAGHLAGLSDRGALLEVMDVYNDMVGHVREGFASNEPPKKGSMEIF